MAPVAPLATPLDWSHIVAIDQFADEYAFVIASPYSNAYLADHSQTRTSKRNYRRFTIGDVIRLHVFACSSVQLQR